ncbi:hypothetical protein D3C84_827510 [compost metagenome]
MPLRFLLREPGTVAPSMMSATSLNTPLGVMPLARLKAICLSRRRSVSPMARSMEPVIRSAYRIARPLRLRAARPMVWISERSERRKPSLSASRIATSDTSGMSRPSRNRLIPTSTSKVPRRRSRMISTRSTVSMSECR